MHLITNQERRNNLRGFESYFFRSEADVELRVRPHSIVVSTLAFHAGDLGA